MIPEAFLRKLPAWAGAGIYGQAVWQWAGLFLLITASGLVLWMAWKPCIRRKGAKARAYGGMLCYGLLGMGLCFGVRYLAHDQIRITGGMLSFLPLGSGVAATLLAGAVIILSGNIALGIILASAKIKEEALDADVIKLLCRLVTFGLVFVLFYHAGGNLGIPVTAVFASAGIAGVAVALAARETLANFFGGVSIFIDRPFRTGDYILLDSGERGEVTAVGMRSTRLITRGHIMISIPNSIIPNAKVVNQSRPAPSFRVGVKIGVAYGSDVDLVESVLQALAGENSLVIPRPEPRVRFRAFGDSALEFELLCWAARPHDKGRLVHELCREIYKRFNKEGIIMPFPQQDVYVHRLET